MKAMGPIPPGFTADSDSMLLIGGQRADDLISTAGGSPLFVYDRSLIASQIERFRATMPPAVSLHYAVKANPYPDLLRFMDRLVDGFDVASAGELTRLREVGTTRPISFAGPGKRDAEIEQAIREAVTINLESEGEAERAIAIAETIGLQPRLAVRVNPPFALRGAGMKMGGSASPFGVDSDRVPALVARIVQAGADWRGFHIFAGSQSLSAESISEAQAATVALAADLADRSFPPPLVNLGGGFGIPYAPGDRRLDIEAIGEALAKTLDQRPDSLADTGFAIELGRWLVGEAGVYLTRVVDRKRSGDRTFLITDGGLHHMLAASGNFGQLLRRNYPVAIADRFGCAAAEEVTITGCLCTPLDLIADAVELPRADVGSLVSLFCAGAYGRTASPGAFLGQPEALEILV